MSILFGLLVSFVCYVLWSLLLQSIEAISNWYRNYPYRRLKKVFEDLGRLNFEDETKIDYQLRRFYKRLKKVNFVKDKCKLCYIEMEYGKRNCPNRRECRKEEMLGELKEMIKQYFDGTKIRREDITKLIKEIKE